MAHNFQKITKIDDIIIDSFVAGQLSDRSTYDILSQEGDHFANLIAFWVPRHHNKNPTLPIIGNITNGSFEPSLIYGANNQWQQQKDELGTHGIMGVFLYCKTIFSQSSDGKDQIHVTVELLLKDFISSIESTQSSKSSNTSNKSEDSKNKRKEKAGTRRQEKANVSTDDENDDEQDDLIRAANEKNAKRKKAADDAKRKKAADDVSPVVENPSLPTSTSVPSQSSDLLSVGSSGPLNSTAIHERAPDFGDGLTNETRDDILSISSREWFRRQWYPTIFKNEVKDGSIHMVEKSLENKPIWIRRENRDTLERGYGIRDHLTELKKSKNREDQYREDPPSKNPVKDDLNFDKLKFDFNRYEYILTSMPDKVRDNIDKESRNSLASEFLLQDYKSKGRFETGQTTDDELKKKIETELRWTYHFMEILRRDPNGGNYLACRWESTGE